MPTIKNENRTLSIQLTPEELEKAGKDLAESCIKIEEAENQESIRRKTVKEAIEGMENERHKFVNLVKTGIRSGIVLVKIEMDKETITEVRTDTGEILMSRPATKEEMQERLWSQIDESAK